jgi:hypothetical protein
MAHRQKGNDLWRLASEDAAEEPQASSAKKTSHTEDFGTPANFEDGL